MGLEARQNRTVLGIEISNGVARGARLDLDRNEIVALGVVRLSAGCCDASGALDASVAGICLDPLLDRLNIVDRSNVEVGIAIGPRHGGVGSGPAMQSWLASRSARLGESITVAGDLGISFAPSRAVDAAAKSILELGLEPVRVDIAPVAAARAFGQQVEGVIRVGSGRGWYARMRNFEVLEAMEAAGVAWDEPMSIEELDGSVTPVRSFGYTEIQPSVWESVTDNLGSMAVAVGSAVGVAFNSSGNLLNGAIVGEPARVDRRSEQMASGQGGELDESTLTLKGRQHGAPAPMHRRPKTAAMPQRPERTSAFAEDAADQGTIDLNLIRRDVENTDSVDETINLNAVANLATESSALTTVPAPQKVFPESSATAARKLALESSAMAARKATLKPSVPVPQSLAPKPSAPAPRKVTLDSLVSAPQKVVPKSSAAARKLVGKSRPTTEVQMAAMAEWDQEALDQTDPINLFSPQTQEDHLRGESTHGFDVLHLMLILIVLGIAAVGAFIFLL